MIAKYRNHSLLYLALAIVLAVVTGFLFYKISHTNVRERGAGLIASCIIAYFAAWVSWVLVGFNLARAKGYHQDFTGTLFVVIYLVGLCLPVIVVGFPIVILFGMKDKARSRSRRH
jgi:ABC-type spermidine/putrescine transport system permease subunit II